MDAQFMAIWEKKELLIWDKKESLVDVLSLDSFFEI